MRSAQVGALHASAIVRIVLDTNVVVSGLLWSGRPARAVGRANEVFEVPEAALDWLKSPDIRGAKLKFENLAMLTPAECLRRQTWQR